MPCHLGEPFLQCCLLVSSTPCTLLPAPARQHVCKCPKPGLPRNSYPTCQQRRVSSAANTDWRSTSAQSASAAPHRWHTQLTTAQGRGCWCGTGCNKRASPSTACMHTVTTPTTLKLPAHSDNTEQERAQGRNTPMLFLCMSSACVAQAGHAPAGICRAESSSGKAGAPAAQTIRHETALTDTTLCSKTAHVQRRGLLRAAAPPHTNAHPHVLRKTPETRSGMAHRPHPSSPRAHRSPPLT